MKQAVAVRFEENGKETYFDPAGLDVHAGDYVMADTEQGAVCGQVSRDPKSTPDYLLPHPLHSLVRLADSVDIRRMHQRQSEDKKAWRICRECIDRHGLEMKLVKVEYAPDHSKVTFYFTADGRVDFRELVKDLASTFHMRIELRQIGVRDESKMMGGIGLCGQTFCCSRFLKDFQPVSIRMAKEQGLSLNPTKISGCCGRLMCCLGYEQSAYEYLNSILPMVGSTVRTPDGTGTVVETNPPSRATCGCGWCPRRWPPNTTRPASASIFRGASGPPAAPTPTTITPACGTRPRWWPAPTPRQTPRNNPP